MGLLSGDFREPGRLSYRCISNRTKLQPDQFQRGLDRLAVLPAGIVHRAAQQVHDAHPDLRLREHRVDRVREAFRPSTTVIRMSLTPRFLSPLTTRIQNFAPSVYSIQVPSTSLRRSGVTPIARYTVVLCTDPLSRILTRSAATKTIA